MFGLRDVPPIGALADERAARPRLVDVREHLLILFGYADI
jgi:hypothetical protein